MGERERQLQTDLRKAYSFLPVKNSPEDLLDYSRRITRNESSELNQKLTDKFKDLISHSPTTKSFKESLGKLFEKMSREGSVNFRENMIQTWGHLLINVLRLDTPEGIFDPTTAKESEKNLRDAVLKSFTDQIIIDEQTGQDINISEFWMSPFFKNFEDGENLLVRWRDEYKNLYGESPCTKISEPMEDLIFRGPQS